MYYLTDYLTDKVFSIIATFLFLCEDYSYSFGKNVLVRVIIGESNLRQVCLQDLANLIIL